MTRGRVMDIRGIMIGMIHEYGRHNGHADIMRELIDGRHRRVAGSSRVGPDGS
jgi:hypothetical protein